MTGNQKILAGRYLLKERMWSESSSQTHRAMDKRTGKEIALKLITDTPLEPPHLESLRMGAERLSGIRHDNVVRVLDMGVDEGKFFLVTESLEGGRFLQDLTSDNYPMRWRDLKPLIVQACDGLQAYHENGLVHRDVKPGKILVLGSGLVKVLHSGMSGLAEGDPADQIGVIRCTLKYMSPEQTRGRPGAIDHRSDIYSLGATMYRMLSGSVPLPGRHLFERIEHTRESPPMPLTLAMPELGIPPVVDLIVMRALSKNPDDRFQTMREMRGALQPY